MPEKALKANQNILLYSKKPTIITGGRDRRLHTDDINNRSDPY